MGRSCTYRMSESEYFHYRQNWWISLRKSGNTTEPLRKRSDFNPALSTLNGLHQESGGRQLRPMPYWKYKQWHLPQVGGNGVDPGNLPKNSEKVNDRGCMQRFMIVRVNPLSTGLWVKPQANGFREFILLFSILLQIDRLQLTAVYCNRRCV